MNRILGKSAGMALLMAAALLAAMFAAGVFSPGGVGAHDGAHSDGEATLDYLAARAGQAATASEGPPDGGSPPSVWNTVEVPPDATHVTFYYSWSSAEFLNNISWPFGYDWYADSATTRANMKTYVYESNADGTWTRKGPSNVADEASANDGSSFDGIAPNKGEHDDIIALEIKLPTDTAGTRATSAPYKVIARDKDLSGNAHTYSSKGYSILLYFGDRLTPDQADILTYLHYINDLDDREAGSAQKLTLKTRLAASDRDEITIDFKEFGVPSSIDPDDVTIVKGVGGGTQEASPGAVEVNGTTVTLTFRTRTGTGAATGIESALPAGTTTEIIFSSGSGITLPKHAGLYPVSVRSEDTAAKDTSFSNYAEVVRSVAASPEKGTLRNTAITFTGKGFNGETVTVTVGDKTLGTATVEDGMFTLDVPSDPRDSNGGRVFTPGENMIKAKESDGEAEVMFNMKNLSPPVRNLKVTPAEGGTTATVSWRKSRPADDKEHRCPSATQRQYRYKVVLWEPGGNVDRTEVVDHTNTSDTTVNLTGLAPGTEYAVLVWSRSDECNNWSKFRRKIWTQPGG